MQDAILILDFDAALAGLIARTLRSQQVYCVPVPRDITLAQAQALSPLGLIIAATHEQAVSLEVLDKALLAADLPMLALGAAVPALCEYYGGGVQQNHAENASVTLSFAEEPLFEGITRGERVLRQLCDLNLSDELICLVTATQRCIGFYHEPNRLYAVQYPIERNDPDAVLLLRNFACLVCGIQPVWTEDLIIEQAVENLRAVAGEGHVLCAISGGVDSAVCAKLAHMAVDDRLTCVFVDTGLFRKDEPQTVIEGYMETIGLVVAYVDARELFLQALHGVHTATDKEQVATTLLRQVLLQQKLYDPTLTTLVLGTNYNDTLYGATPVQPLPSEVPLASLRLVEPVRNLFKDEVRRLAQALSLPGSIAERQPFPASGLALRIYDEVTPERLNILRSADAAFSEEICGGGHERRLWQYYASMSDNPDERHGYAIVLRASQACSGEACASRLPFDLLERVTQRVLETLPEVTQVLYDLTPSQSYSQVE